MAEKQRYSTGSTFTEKFVRQFTRRKFREIYVADKVRTRTAMMIRALREQRGWSQKALGEKMGKPQSVVSRLEDPEYGKLSVQTLLDVAAAFELPLHIDMPEWEDWFALMQDFSETSLKRRSFDADHLTRQHQPFDVSIQTAHFNKAQLQEIHSLFSTVGMLQSLQQTSKNLRVPNREAKNMPSEHRFSDQAYEKKSQPSILRKVL